MPAAEGWHAPDDAGHRQIAKYIVQTRREDTQSHKVSVTLADQLGLVCQRHYHSNADIK